MFLKVILAIIQHNYLKRNQKAPNYFAIKNLLWTHRCAVVGNPGGGSLGFWPNSFEGGT